MKLSFKIAAIVLVGIILAASATIFLVLPKADLLKIFITLLLVVVPVSALIWFLIYKLVIKPILNLNVTSKIIASGNLGKRVNIKAIDELGELAQNFNTVINHLTSGMQNMANSLRDEKLKEKELAANFLELERGRAKDEALLRSIGDGVIAIDRQKKIILFNEAAGKMIGRESTEVIGEPYNFALKLVDEKDHSPVEDFISMVLNGEKLAVSNRLMLERINGEMLPILHTISPILDNQKKITGVVVVLKDITWERELEKLKDEFVSLASHELRTPMTAIKGLISMIFEGDYGQLSEGLKDPLSDIAKSTERLIQLVNDMLDVSRIESGRTKFTPTEVSLPGLIEEVLEMLKPLAAQKNIQMEVSGTVTNKVNADADKVRQITINLLSNAIKFTDHGNIVISFRSFGKFAYISVTDSGIGIARENQSKLFSKFAQISSSQLGRPPGTGLGLYISREFSRGMGGEMWIERSEPGKGTTFTFALPFVNNVI